jgi:secondary thiamine-phosphate synthase enzyme
MNPAMMRLLSTISIKCHTRMVLTRSSESVPVAHGEMQLGTWQGIFLFEHRSAAHTRSIVVNVMGV